MATQIAAILVEDAEGFNTEVQSGTGPEGSLKRKAGENRRPALRKERMLRRSASGTWGARGPACCGGLQLQTRRKPG